MKKLTFLLVALMALVFMSCEQHATPTADKEQQVQTEIAMAEAQREVGMPAIINFQEKKTVKWIYELCDDENLICHAYLVNEMNGSIGQYLGKCMGYGVPYSTQFSNPEKMVNGGKMLGYNPYSETIQPMPQAEPNGLFKPEGLSATWLIMIDPETNKPRPLYIEPAIIVSPFKLH